MSPTLRRILYGALAALGFALMMPFSIQARLWRGQMAAGGLSVEAVRGAEALTGPALLAALGFALAVVFLYAALTTGEPAVWRPRENGEVRCRRCDAAVGFGVRRCPECRQQFVW